MRVPTPVRRQPKSGGARQTLIQWAAMFLVTCKQGNHRWVSGIFCKRTDALAYVEEVPDELRALQVIVEAPHSEYPVYLVEDVGFVVHSAASLGEFLAGLPRVDDDDRCYCNVYRVAEDWRPPRAGTDFMGAMRHVHIENRHLEKVGADGIDALW